MSGESSGLSVQNGYFVALYLRLVEEAANAFPTDPSTASVTVAKLPDGTWYGSVLRYKQAFGEGRQTVARARARDNLQGCWYCLRSSSVLRSM